MRAEFSTGAGSAWLVLLNLTGEYPLANYALWGRLLSVLSSLCAIGVFAIPTGIVADGLEAALAKVPPSPFPLSPFPSLFLQGIRFCGVWPIPC